MRINQNIPALNTYNQLSRNQTELGKVLEKLSSGVRINRAADDAAGMAISEKMKAQIRGLSQAERNGLDGISMLQTIDGALQNIQDMLQRGRELTIQAANGTLMAEDRAAIQDEIDQLKRSVDDIANNTQFNEIELLRPPREVTPPEAGGASEKVDIVFFIDDSGTMGEEIDEVVNGISDFVDGLSAYGDVQVATVSTVHPGRTLALTGDIAAIKTHLENVHISTGGTSGPYAHMISYAPDGATASDIGYRDNSKKIFVLLTDTYNETGGSTEGSVKAKLDEHGIYSYVFGINISGTAAGSPNTFSYESEYDGFANEVIMPVTAADIAESISPGLVDKIVTDAALGTEEEREFEPVILQIGPNETEQFVFHLFDARVENLGLKDVSVLTDAAIQEAISKWDDALTLVQAKRSQFGAYQNALEHIVTNVTTYAENATAAQSRIADADMAKEMTDFTRRNILTQSAQAMLAQSNQLPQGLLQLLN